jgi:tetratricopeptide (TPR) repeat protein
MRAIVEGCEMDAREIFRYAIDDGAVCRFVAEARRLAPHTKDFPSAVFVTVCRMRAWNDEQSEGVDLDAIDQQRYENPKVALRAIERALHAVSGPKTYARALGIWGSAQRMCYRLDYATMGIGLAIEAAQAACDRELVCDLLVRAAYVLRDRGELDWALEISDVLLEQRASLRDHEGMGRAFVVHGELLRISGNPMDSVRCSRAGLGLLRADSLDWRFMAYQCLSLIYIEQRDLEAAEEAARAAQSLGISNSSLTGRLAWSRGRIAHRRGEFAIASRFYREALTLLEGEAIDVGLVGAELVRLLLEAHRVRDAQILAASLSRIADVVSEHPLDFGQTISAALLDLSLAGLEAKASVALVSRVVESIERGRAASTDRLRRDLRL